MSDIALRLATIRNEITDACRQAGRDPAGVEIVAVTKNSQSAVLPYLRAAGIGDFGENRLDHLESMQASAVPGDRWHYLGRVQGRQLPAVAQRAAVLHSLCDPDHVLRLGRACAGLGRRMTVYLQVNVSGESAKAGITPDALPHVLDLARAQPQLDVAGLMTMAPELGVHATPEGVRACFARLRELAAMHGLRGLSMGMSGDFTLAIAEGATVIRIGSRIFA